VGRQALNLDGFDLAVKAAIAHINATYTATGEAGYVNILSALYETLT